MPLKKVNLGVIGFGARGSKVEPVPFCHTIKNSIKKTKNFHFPKI